MEHKSLERLQCLGEANVSRMHPALSRNDRLVRWAKLLESQPERVLSTLHGTEYQPATTRETMRRAASPISIALEDPLLRAEGLASDSYREAKRFFGLDDKQLHRIICGCDLGETVSAVHAARLVRSAKTGILTGLLARLHDLGRR